MDTQVEVVGLPKHAWVLWLVMGLLSVVIGTWLVFSPEAAIATLALLLAIALFFTAEPVIENWVGSDYVAEAAPVLRIALLNVLISAAFAPAVGILSGLARVRELFLITVIEMLVAGALVALTARGGLPALATSLLVANFAANFGLVLPLVCRTLEVPAHRYLWRVIALPLCAALPAVGLAALLRQYWIPETWLAVGLVGGLVGLLYALTFLGLCVSRREREEMYQHASRMLADGTG